MPQGCQAPVSNFGILRSHFAELEGSEEERSNAGGLAVFCSRRGQHQGRSGIVVVEVGGSRSGGGSSSSSSSDQRRCQSSVVGRRSLASYKSDYLMGMCRTCGRGLVAAAWYGPGIRGMRQDRECDCE